MGCAVDCPSTRILLAAAIFMPRRVRPSPADRRPATSESPACRRSQSSPPNPMSVSEAALVAALATVVDPHTGQPYSAGRQLKNVKIGADGAVSFDLELGYPARSQFAAVREALAQAAKTVDGVGAVSVDISTRIV